jgi:hypothetical protein
VAAASALFIGGDLIQGFHFKSTGRIGVRTPFMELLRPTLNQMQDEGLLVSRWMEYERKPPEYFRVERPVREIQWALKDSKQLCRECKEGKPRRH